MNHKILLFTAIITMLTACSKDDKDTVPVYEKENPLQGFLEATGFNEHVEDVADFRHLETGLRFKPVVKGVISAVTVRVPDINTFMKVTIWDVENIEPIRTTVLRVVNAGEPVSIAIPALPVTPDKEYIISMNLNNYYKYTRLEKPTAVAYPVNVGNIMFTGFGYIESAELAMPVIFPNNYYFGELSFDFQRTN